MLCCDALWQCQSDFTIWKTSSFSEKHIVLVPWSLDHHCCWNFKFKISSHFSEYLDHDGSSQQTIIVVDTFNSGLYSVLERILKSAGFFKKGTTIWDYSQHHVLLIGRSCFRLEYCLFIIEFNPQSPTYEALKQRFPLLTVIRSNKLPASSFLLCQ